MRLGSARPQRTGFPPGQSAARNPTLCPPPGPSDRSVRDPGEVPSLLKPAGADPGGERERGPRVGGWERLGLQPLPETDTHLPPTIFQRCCEVQGRRAGCRARARESGCEGEIFLGRPGHAPQELLRCASFWTRCLSLQAALLDPELRLHRRLGDEAERARATMVRRDWYRGHPV